MKYGIVFRVINPRLKNFGRLSVAQDSFGSALSGNKEQSTLLANVLNGFIVPIERAERMLIKKLYHNRK